MQRRRDLLVELAESLQRSDPLAVQMRGLAGKADQDVDRLGAQPVHEARAVKAADATAEKLRRRREIVGHGDRRRRAHGAGRAHSAEPFQEHATAQRETDRVKWRPRFARGQRADDEFEVVGLARVVQARPPVAQPPADPCRIPRAAAEIEHGAAPAGLRNQPRQPLRVQRVGTALEPVQQEHARCPRRARQVVQHQVVVIVGDQNLARERDHVARACDARPDRLQVGAREPPRLRRGSISGLHAVHLGMPTGDAPVTTARRLCKLDVRDAMGRQPTLYCGACRIQ
jgi:hypothetical protein